MRIAKALIELKALNNQLKKYLLCYNNSPVLDYNSKNCEEDYIFDKIFFIVECLKLTSRDIEYINSPVLIEGKIKMKDNEIFINNIKLSGCKKIELFMNNAWNDYIIHKEKNIYYFDGYPITSILKNNNNIKARIRDYSYS